MTDWSQHLPILLVVAPMLAAPFCLLVRRPRSSWALALAVTLASLVCSVVLLQRTLTEGPVSYEVGGWPPPWGIELRFDILNAFVATVVTGIAAIVLVGAPESLKNELRRPKHYLFFAAYLLCLTGLLGMTCAGDAFNIFVFLEISSLSAYSLVALGRKRRALLAAFRYLIVGTLGGTMLLVGIGFLYAATGTLNLVDLFERLALVPTDRTILMALVFIVVGVGIKLALLPFGAWLPDAYTYAPSVVSAFLSATATKVALYLLIRFLFGVFGPQLAFDRLQLHWILIPLSLVSILVGSALAIVQNDVKRVLAFSSLAQIGYMALGLAIATSAGLTASVLHLANHALMKSGLFMAVAGFVSRTRNSSVESLRGLGKRMPLTSAAFVAGGLGLVGVPLTAGFVSKWYLLTATIEVNRYLSAFLILVGSLLALAYVWRLVELLYRNPKEPFGPEIKEAPWPILLATWILIGGSLLFGVYTDLSVDIAERAVEMLEGAQ